MKLKAELVSNPPKYFFLVSVLLFVIGFSAFSQTTVYIDPGYSGGSNDGSIDHPFIHWSNIPGYPDVLQDNTFYMQKRGTRDTINANIHPYQNTGITFGVYGTGTDYAYIVNKKPGGKTFDITASNHITVDGFHLKGTATGSGASTSYITTCGVSVAGDWDNTSTFVAYNTTIKNCFIEKSTSGIRAFNNGFDPFDTIIIENVIIHDIYEDGMYIQLSTKVPFYGLDINNCYVDSVNMGYNYRGGDETQNPGDGIQLVDLVTSFKLRNTTIDRRNSSNKFCFISGNSVLHHLNRGLIENCTFYAPNVGFGGCALYLDDLDSIIVRNNHIFCNEKSTIMMLRNGTSLACSFNTFSGMGSSKAGIGFDMVASGPNKFDNNTFYFVQSVFHTNGTTSEVYNNIFSNIGTVYPGSVLTTPDNNLYFNATAGGTELHSLYNQDPLLVDPSNGNFRLLPGSPCIDKGRDLGFTADIVGAKLPHGSGYDIGAYEYVSSDTLPPSIPAGLTASGITYTGFTLSWNSSMDNVGVARYNIYKDGLFIKSVGDTSAIITGLVQGKTYTMTVNASDTDGNLSAADTLIVSTPGSSDKLAPSVPDELSATELTATSFNLHWTASIDNVKVTEYDVYVDGELYSIVKGNSASIIGLTTGVSYSLTITARDTVGNTSAASAAFPVTTILICTGSDAWANTRFPNQTGTFTVEYDVIPQSGSVIALTGLSDGPALTYSSLSCIVGFTATGTVNARDTSVYHAANLFSYNSGTTYHIRMVVDMYTMKYDAYIKATGGSAETVIASQYGFRAKTIQLNNFVEEADACHLNVSNLSVATTTDVSTVSPGIASCLIYPNPATDEINIKVEEASTVSIFTIDGKLLVNRSIPQGITRWPIKLEKGLYIIRVTDINNMITIRKLIVE